MSTDLLVERAGPDGSVPTLVLNRPDSHNAINLGMYRALPGLLGRIEHDSSVKVLVVRGAGEKAFASGADISEFGQVRANAQTATDYNEAVAAAARALALGLADEMAPGEDLDKLTYES
ncbi:MAG: enoyl-CoA hydratase/isomerase family protein [Actinomycetes bacterium]